MVALSFDQLDPLEQTATADVPDDLVCLAQLSQPVTEDLAEGSHPLDQSVALDDVQHGPGDCRRERVGDMGGEEEESPVTLVLQAREVPLGELDDAAAGEDRLEDAGGEVRVPGISGPYPRRPAEKWRRPRPRTALIWPEVKSRTARSWSSKT